MAWWTAVIILALAGLSLLAYALRALDKSGAIVSFLLGLVIAFAGDLNWIFLMAIFTGAGVLATRFGYSDKARRKIAEEHGGERSVGNVLANGGAAALAAIANALDVIPDGAAAFAFVTAMAAVTADTMASELGSLQKRARRIIPPFAYAQAGENGAVSWAGQFAAAGGALLIAGLSIPLLGIPAVWAWVPALAGFLGCQLDSVLGATLEGDQKREGPLSKEDVNFIASAVPAFIVLVVASLL